MIKFQLIDNQAPRHDRRSYTCNFCVIQYLPQLPVYFIMLISIIISRQIVLFLNNLLIEKLHKLTNIRVKSVLDLDI